MTTNFAPTATARATGQFSIIARVAAAAIATSFARAKARRDYRRLLEREDHILRDMGVTRSDALHALFEVGGRS